MSISNLLAFFKKHVSKQAHLALNTFLIWGIFIKKQSMFYNLLCNKNANKGWNQRSGLLVVKYAIKEISYYYQTWWASVWGRKLTLRKTSSPNGKVCVDCCLSFGGLFFCCCCCRANLSFDDNRDHQLKQRSELTMEQQCIIKLDIRVLQRELLDTLNSKQSIQLTASFVYPLSHCYIGTKVADASIPTGLSIRMLETELSSYSGCCV